MRLIFIFVAALTSALAGCETSQLASVESPVAESGVYFSSNRSGNYEVYHLENDQLKQLTTDDRYDSWWPRQSPGGRSMLFYRSLVSDRPAQGGHNNNYNNASLWLLDIETTLTTELIPKGAHSWNAQGVADWSPDGTRLLMAAIEGSTNRWHLYVSDTDGSDPVKISRRASLFLDPSWSPDGSSIVYVAFPPDYNGVDIDRLEVFTADADGSNELRLTSDTLRDHDPYWSPDGTLIAFETAVDPAYFGVGKWAIRAVDPLGISVATILDDGNINTLPRWSADGQRIYFHRFIFGSDHGFIVAVINADGSGYQEITSGGAYDDTDLDWYKSIP